MFCERLKHLREEQKLTQEQLGAILGVSRFAITKYEIGERLPDAVMLGKIADFFSVSLDYLMCRSSIRNIDDHVLVSSLRNAYKNCSPAVINMVDTVCNIIESSKNDNKIIIFNDLINTASKLL